MAGDPEPGDEGWVHTGPDLLDVLTGDDEDPPADLLSLLHLHNAAGCD